MWGKVWASWSKHNLRRHLEMTDLSSTKGLVLCLVKLLSGMHGIRLLALHLCILLLRLDCRHALFDEIFETLDRDLKIRMAIRDDLMAIRTRDAACNSVLDAFL